ncbi:MAG: acyl-CoA dehydrogenase [Candidatus Dadabacteria bacterium]|nr:MAG: acyl-CoA dehydrogenase [Candidatus Dadabacteria bacterium]
MIRLKISEETEKFRQEFQSWLKDHRPPEIDSDCSLETFEKAGRQWQRELASGRWVAVHWPEEYGGRSLSLVEEAIVQEELVRVNSPQLLGLFGLTMVGPVLIEHGTAEQKKKYLPSILNADEIWCQGFSEPGAGSDLAAIKTRARVEKDGFYITGQKVWTSFAHIADWCFLLVRTSDHEKKHKGLTYLLVDMHQDGITTRPLKQITGDQEFNEVFFDNAFAPAENVVGEVGEGWKIAISTLMYERVVLTFARQLQSEVALSQLLERTAGDTDSAQQLMLSGEVAKACAVRALAYKHLLDYAAGKKPGPEGSLDKLFWTESFQSISRLAMEFDGFDVLEGADSASAGSDVQRYLYSRGRTIAAGTSEIQKNIIAERLLGMPRLKYSE